MQETKTCTTCAGTGHPVKALPGGGFGRDYQSLCGSCLGKGYIYVKKKQPPTTSTSPGGSGCILTILTIISVSGFFIIIACII